MVAPKGTTNFEVDRLTPAASVQESVVGSVAEELAVPKAVSNARNK